MSIKKANMFHQKKLLALIIPAWSLLVLCTGCGNKEDSTPAGPPPASGISSLPPQAQAAAQAQEKADAAARAARPTQTGQPTH